MQSRSLIRRLLLAMMIALLIVALCLLIGTDRGWDLMKHPDHRGQEVREWVGNHPFTAPVVFLTVMVSLGCLGLPIWWMQVLAGFGFGLLMGIFWSQLGATLAAVGAASLSRFILSDWFHQRVEKQIARLHRLDHKLGHNGLLVVCMVRLAHFIPAGPANLAMGLSRISIRDIAIGTAVGGIPTASIFVSIGASRELLHDWRFIACIAAVNILMLGGILLRYLRPDWFRSVGVE